MRSFKDYVLFNEAVKNRNDFRKFIVNEGINKIKNQNNKTYNMSIQLNYKHETELLFYCKKYLDETHEQLHIKKILNAEKFKPLTVESDEFILILRPTFYKTLSPNERYVDITTYDYVLSDDDDFIELIRNEESDLLIIYDFEIVYKTEPKPSLTDDELIDLFEDKKKLNKKNKKTKKQTTETTTTTTTTKTTTTTTIDDDDIVNTTEKKDDLKDEITENLLEKDINNIYLFHHLKFSYNKHIYFSTNQKQEIYELLDDLYKNNNKFVQLLNEYNEMWIIKPPHYDNERTKKGYHFNVKLLKSGFNDVIYTYHLYIVNNRIERITYINNVL